MGQKYKTSNEEQRRELSIKELREHRRGDMDFLFFSFYTINAPHYEATLDNKIN